MSSATSSSASSSSGGSSNHDRTDRTSLQCLEQKLLDLKQKAQAKSDKNAAAEIHSSKPKSLSPSGLKQNKEFIHRRKEDFITNSEGRKKTSLSPMKKTIKKSLSLPAGKDNKMGNLFCPTTDAKVTILPCNKPNGKDVDLKPASAANSVTITKLSSGDSLNVPPKDIKKMFNSKSEMKTKTSSGHSKLSMKKSSGEKQRLSTGEKVHRDHKSRERNREEGGGKQRHIGCSKCREQFSTKEAKKLHTCNSILDAHYLIDGGDRQKTSPTSSVSTSESNSASLSRSSSRSSSPGLPSTVVNTVKKTPTTPTSGETPKLKISMKPGERSSEKPKVRKEDCSDKMKVKRDSMKEKWVESKSSSQKSDIHGDDLVTKDDRTRITIEAMKPEESDPEKTAASLEIVRMEGAKDDSTAGDRIDHAFAFTGKRTYSPSMSETASVEGKESPRETNSKDSPASQADSGVFSIASSASPSKVDGVLNSDVRSPDSPTSRERLGCSVADVNQWTKSSLPMAAGGHPTTTTGETAAPPQAQPSLPLQGIQIPHSLSITRVMSQAQPTYPSNPVTSTTMGGGPNKNMGILANAPWMGAGGPNISPNFYAGAMLDDINKKKRGRPRKSDFEARMARMKGGKGGKDDDDDKDLYDFGAEDDESKPMQPLRPRRQNMGAPSSYKDPDSDEDAKQRPPEQQLIHQTQAFRQAHDLALNQVDGIGHNLNPPENSISDPNGENANEGGEKDEKNVSYTCSKIEETPKGGIKLKIKIKKSASPAPLDPEPPIKKTKLEGGEVEGQGQFPKQEASILSTMSEMQRLANGLGRPPGGPGGGPGPMDNVRSPAKHPHMLSPHAAPWLKPGMPGGGEPGGGVGLQGNPGQQPNPAMHPQMRQPGPNPVSSSAAAAEEAGSRSGGDFPKTHNPYTGMQTNLQNNFPGHGQTVPHSNPNYGDVPQQNFPQGGGGFGDYGNYNSGYSQQQHGWSMEQQMYQRQQLYQQQQQHMAAFRHGGPQGGMPPMGMRPGFMPQGMMQRHPGVEMPGGQRMPVHPGMDMPGGQRMPGHPGMDMPGGQRMPGHPGMEMPGGPRMTGHPGMDVGSRMPGHPGMEMPPGARMSHPGMMGQMMGPGMGPRGPQGMPGYPGMGPSGLVRPPSLSPALVSAPSRSPQADWTGAFPAGQYRTASPQYSQAQAHFSNSPTYSSAHGYSGPPTPGTYQNPPSVGTQPPLTPGGSYQNPTTPGSYPNPTTPVSYPSSTTPVSFPNPTTPVSVPNPGGPTTPVSYPNPTTPVSYPNPTTPGSYPNPSTPNSQHNPLTPQPQDSGSASKLGTNNSVIQQNPLAASSTFSSPKNEPLDPPKSSIPNLFNKDSAKALTPMLSPPSTTSSLRKIRRPSKSVTPNQSSPPNQKMLSSPSQQVKSEGGEMISPLQVKREVDLDSPVVAPTSNENNGAAGSDNSTPVKSEQEGPSPKREKLAPSPPASAPPPQLPPPTVKTPEPPKEPRWGVDGEDGMPEKALKLIFHYVCYTQGCLPFLPYAMRTCKLWNKVALDPELWTHANLGTNVKEKLRTEKKLEWILKNKFPNAIDVDVQNWRAAMSAPALKIIAANCPKLTGLGMSSCVKLTYEDVRIIPSLFPNLEKIDLSSVSPSTASSRSAASSTCLSDMITAVGEKLISFNISNNKMAGLPFVFKAISQHSKNLRALDVSNITTTSRDTIMINIEKLAKGCPKLTKFRTTNTMLGLNETPIREQIASPGFPYLEELTIGVDQRGYFDGMDDNQIERILKKSAKLRVLDIRGCKSITDSTLVRLPCWDIEYLQVAGSSICTSSRDGLELLVKKWCRTLQELDIATTTDSRTVDWALIALVENEEYLKLRKLNLNGTGVSLKALTKLLNCCPTLESLNLTSCRALPRGMKRMYHNREDVAGLAKDISEGKFDPQDAGSDDDR